METATYEYNAAAVNAYSSKFGGPGIDIGYELLRREVGKRKWEVVGKTQDWREAYDWAAQSGFILRQPRN